MSAAFRLRVGSLGPQQQSAVSCGAACLVVARMLVDAPFATWVGLGDAGADGGPEARFAEAERLVMARTNAAAPSAGRTQLPWPRFFGTSPWGALAELETGGVPYEPVVLRHLGAAALRDAWTDLTRRVRPGAPALLYVGNVVLPRHITLLFVPERGAGARSAEVALYEPASGRVLPHRDLDLGRCRLAGWRTPWFALAPTGTIRAAGAATQRPRPVGGIVPESA